MTPRELRRDAMDQHRQRVAPRLIRRCHLLPIGFLSLLGMLIALVPLYPNDLWWHLRIGELIAHSGNPLALERFSFLPQEQDFPYHGWLGQLLLYLAWLPAGSASLMLVRNLCLLLAYGLALLLAARRSGSWAVAGALTLLAGLSAFFYWHIRPQIFAYPLFVVILALLLGVADGRMERRWLIGVPLLTALWTNLHGSFVIAPLLAGVAAVGALLEAKRARSWRRSASALTLTALATGLATLVTPYGWRVYDVVGAALQDAPSLIFGPEWHPPSPASNPLLFGTIFATLGCWAVQRRRPTLVEGGFYLVLAWQACAGNRYIIWYSLALPLLAAPAVAALLPHRAAPPLEWPALNLVLAALLSLPTLGMQPGMPLRAWLPETYQAHLTADETGRLLLARATPVAAARYLRSHPLGAAARLFSENADASYLIWAWREGRVFLDTRISAYPLPVWLDYYQIAAACEYNRLLDRYGITHVLANRVKQPALAAALASDPRWQPLWRDATYTLYQRSARPPAEPPCRMDALLELLRP